MTINVARSKDEAEIQARTGRAIPRAGEEEMSADVAIEEQAKAVFEEEVVDQAIEDLQVDEAAEKTVEADPKDVS